jgi:hypothetical protein
MQDTMLCCFLVRAIYKFGSRIVINRTTNKWKHVESDRNVLHVCCLHNLHLEMRTTIHAVKASALLLIND